MKFDKGETQIVLLRNFYDNNDDDHLHRHHSNDPDTGKIMK